MRPGSPAVAAAIHAPQALVGAAPRVGGALRGRPRPQSPGPLPGSPVAALRVATLPRTSAARSGQRAGPQQVLGRVAGATQHHPSGAVAVGDDSAARVEAGLGEQAQRESNLPLGTDLDLLGLSQHLERVPHGRSAPPAGNVGRWQGRPAGDRVVGATRVVTGYRVGLS